VRRDRVDSRFTARAFYIRFQCYATLIRHQAFRGPSSWTYRNTSDMACHMKTTLNIDDTVMAQLKREAARQGRTMSKLVETALRLLLQTQKSRRPVPPLPSFKGGEFLVDIADRDALYQAMEGR